MHPANTQLRRDDVPPQHITGECDGPQSCLTILTLLRTWLRERWSAQSPGLPPAGLGRLRSAYDGILGRIDKGPRPPASRKMSWRHSAGTRSWNSEVPTRPSLPLRPALQRVTELPQEVDTDHGHNRAE